MAIPATRLLRQIRKSFRDTHSAMSAMHDAVQIRPADEEVIRLVDAADGIANFECDPVVCCVPERASAPRADLYVVFSGKLALYTDAAVGEAVTARYATNFAYFKLSQTGAIHPFGGHYDCADDDIGHPRAHLQLRSQVQMWANAEASFPSLMGIQIELDPMSHVLNRVRAPSAQMDFLSFMTQVAADHLVDGKSSHSTRGRFLKLTETCVPFLGHEAPAGHGSWVCRRAGHWYPRA